MSGPRISRKTAQEALKIIDGLSLSKVHKNELIKRAYHVGLFLLGAFLTAAIAEIEDDE